MSHHKKIIVCCDGTWNDPQQLDRGIIAPTNVVKIARALSLSEKHSRQVIFYDKGVGTEGSRFKRYRDGITGSGVMKNIFQAYEFIAEQYDPGDKIYLFGFSRGAYTARSLAGVLRLLGIEKALRKPDLPNKPVKTNNGKCTDTWITPSGQPNKTIETLQNQYIQLRKATDLKLIERHRIDNQNEIPNVEMIGVWDTVGALGSPLRFIPISYNQKINDYFHEVLRLGPHVKAAYHALAIHENRKKFQPLLWQDGEYPHQILKQVWFAGIHSNVGGGYSNTGLSDYPLLWMIDCAKQHGLEFNEVYINTHICPDIKNGKMRSERDTTFKRLIFKVAERDMKVLCDRLNVKTYIAQSAFDYFGVNGSPYFPSHPY